jgi:hypothetical protein
MQVRGKFMIISTLTPALSRQRERGYMLFLPPLEGFPKVVLLPVGEASV